MRIEYVGHSCFYLVTEDGVRIIIDPYDDSMGLTHVDKEADVALVSHHHFDHCYLDGVRGGYELVDGPGTYDIRGIHVTGLEVPHDDAGGQKRGMVTAYVIEADNVRILHMSDVGAMPPDSFFEELPGRIDVLMIPVGGKYTVDAQGAFEISERLDPSAVIPMHYKTTRLTLDIAPPDKFIQIAHQSFDIQRQGDVLMVPAGIHKKRGRVIVMENSY